MNEKKEKFIIFALAGILLLIVCLPVKKETNDASASSKLNNISYLKKEEGNKDIDAQDGNGGAGEDGTNSGDGSDAVPAWKEDSGADTSYRKQMERELEELLSCMEGVGRVRVMITLRSTGEEIVEKDRPAVRSNLSEQDAAGGNRSTNDLNSEEETVFVTDADGRQVPYVRKTMQPVVEGVAVLAEGGGNETVCVNISEAIQALFDLDANKIKIAKMKTTK
ncbi:MAG: hypothetical protein J6C33_00305 [Lachnospiraceae bacterium]|nr:hypothetical protein [Lachnospiraceae bacterium]